MTTIVSTTSASNGRGPPREQLEGYNAVGADPSTNPDPAIAAQALVDHSQAVPMLATFLNSPYADARLLDSYSNDAGWRRTSRGSLLLDPGRQSFSRTLSGVFRRR
jgi:hypothetical protein